MTLAWFGTANLLVALQAGQATLAGSVRDGVSGDPLPGAVVVLTDLDRRAVTDAAGRYTFVVVPAGPQHVVVRRVGYAPRTLHALVPRDGVIEITVGLDPQPITLPPLEASSTVPVRALDDGDPRHPDRGLSIAAIRDHPLLAEPDALQALGGGEVMLRPEAPSGLHVRGGASDQIAFLLDGIPVLSPYYVAGAFSAWNPDALAHVQLSTAGADWGFPNALSGVVSASTRTPGPRLGAQGSVSTSQARLTVDGPLGPSGGGYLVSVRSGFPGFPRPKREASYLQGENGDWLAKLEAPLAGGQVRVLGYGLNSELGAAAAVPSEGSAVASIQNGLRWYSLSLGAEWTGALGGAKVQVRAWRARADAGALWSTGDSTAEDLRAERRDEGALAVAVLAGRRGRTTVGARAERSRTVYELSPLGAAGPSLALSARTPVVALFAEHARSITPTTELELGLVGAWAAGAVHPDPRARLRWTPSRAVSISGEYQRVHQFAQSLRNPESVVATVFPVDLYVGAGGSAVPVARSDQGIVAVEYRPTAGVRVGAHAYARAIDGLVLVAPRDADPFATSGFVVGNGRARGVALEAGARAARYGLLATYGLQDVSLSFGDSSYVPEHGATHAFDAGVTWYGSATFSLRLGASGLVGRRVTGVTGPLEWEACNLRDRGCEFAGSPRVRTEPLGATRLPAYLRMDVGFRKHWHIELAGRDGLVALFGTVTNVLGRGNVLTLAGDPGTGVRQVIEMRPRAPLVVGVDWRF